MFKLVALKNIDKKGSFTHDDSSYSESMNDSHKVNEVDVMGICNNNTCPCKHQQADKAKLIPAKAI